MIGMLDKHPDFIVTVAGRDVTSDTLSWKIQDNEEKSSTITATLDNKDLKYSGFVKAGDTIALRFGHEGNMAAYAELTIKKYKEMLSSRGCTVTITGLDKTHKLSGRQGRGRHKKNQKASSKIDEIAKQVKMQVEKGDMDVPDVSNECSGGACPAGQTLDQNVSNLAGQCADTKKADGPSNPLDDGSNDGSDSTLHAKVREALAGLDANKKKKKQEHNRARNARNTARSSPITGSIALVGYPLIKGKMCVTLVDVGPQASGKWYVKSCEHSWSAGAGYKTKASLIKPGLGKVTNAGGQPIVYYADIWKKDTMYVGPRKIDGPSQATFVWGDGQYLESFEWQVDGEKGRGTGSRAAGKAIDPEAPQKPVVKIDSNQDPDTRSDIDPE